MGYNASHNIKGTNSIPNVNFTLCHLCYWFNDSYVCQLNQPHGCITEAFSNSHKIYAYD